MTGQVVEEMDAHGVWVAGEYLPARGVLWAAVVQASSVGAWLEAEIDQKGRVLVERNLMVPGHPDIFVIGDTAHLTIDDKPLPGVAPVAKQQGHFVAQVIRRWIAGDATQRPFRYRGKGRLATVGWGWAIADLGPVQISGRLSWVVWGTVHLFYLISARDRLAVLLHWAWAYSTHHRGVRFITEYEQGEDMPQAHSLHPQDEGARHST